MIGEIFTFPVHADEDGAFVALEQVVVRTSGSCDFSLDDGTKRGTHRLDSPTKGLHIKGNVWR